MFRKEILVIMIGIMLLTGCDHMEYSRVTGTSDQGISTESENRGDRDDGLKEYRKLADAVVKAVYIKDPESVAVLKKYKWGETLLAKLNDMDNQKMYLSKWIDDGEEHNEEEQDFIWYPEETFLEQYKNEFIQRYGQDIKGETLEEKAYEYAIAREEERQKLQITDNKSSEVGDVTNSELIKYDEKGEPYVYLKDVAFDERGYGSVNYSGVTLALCNEGYEPTWTSIVNENRYYRYATFAKGEESVEIVYKLNGKDETKSVIFMTGINGQVTDLVRAQQILCKS